MSHHALDHVDGYAIVNRPGGAHPATESPTICQTARRYTTTASTVVPAHRYVADDTGLPGRSWTEGRARCGPGVAGGGGYPAIL